MAASGQGPTASEYVIHHLTHLNTLGRPQESLVDFSVFHLDTLFFSISLGVLTVWLLYRAARHATSGVPGRFQNFVEMLVEMVNEQAKGVVHDPESRKFAAPLALTVFVWIFWMNFMDLIPVDLLPRIWEGIYAAAGGDPHHAYLRVVPTADLNATLGMSVAVLLITLYYNLKIKGVGGWLHELFTAPFGNHPLLYLVNFAMQIVEYIAKTVSHGMRLFGNLYAGELIFILIALLGGTATVFGFIGHVIAGSIWAIFHILIIVLQAFIFMMLTLIYIGQAHESH
ncbi:F0F1 ATP synthase subunit A [Hydrogenophilus hirschii]